MECPSLPMVRHCAAQLLLCHFACNRKEGLQRRGCTSFLEADDIDVRDDGRSVDLELDRPVLRKRPFIEQHGETQPFGYGGHDAFAAADLDEGRARFCGGSKELLEGALRRRARLSADQRVLAE